MAGRATITTGHFRTSRTANLPQLSGGGGWLQATWRGARGSFSSPDPLFALNRPALAPIWPKAHDRHRALFTQRTHGEAVLDRRTSLACSDSGSLPPMIFS